MELAQIDMRKQVDVGIRRDTLKKFKEDARKLLKAQGVEFEKAAYGSAKGATKAKPAAKAKAAPAPAAASNGSKATKVVEPVLAEVAAKPQSADPVEPKRGFFKRLLRL